MLSFIQLLNPPQNKIDVRPIERLCSGQTLLCKSLRITVKEWDLQQFDPNQFYLKDVHYVPKKIIQTTRMGIPEGRDEHLLNRFIDFDYAKYCTSNPLTKRKYVMKIILIR